MKTPILPEPNEHGLYQTVDSRSWENEAEALRIAIVASVAVLDEEGEMELFYARLNRLSELAGARVFKSAAGDTKKINALRDLFVEVMQIDSENRKSGRGIYAEND